MPETKRTEALHRCPSCKRRVKPFVLEEIPAFPKANPPIPARQRVRCSAVGCRHMWYVPV
jgi:hypothetical protein